jgi:hypothetical protein
MKKYLDITVNPPNPDGLAVMQIGMKDGTTKRIIINGRIDLPLFHMEVNDDGSFSFTHGPRKKHDGAT